jgi:hypothetical protein
MIFAAQIDPQTKSLKQGLGFANTAMAKAHFEAHPECIYVSASEFVSPETHQYVNGVVVRKDQEEHL